MAQKPNCGKELMYKTYIRIKQELFRTLGWAEVCQRGTETTNQEGKT